MDEGDFAWLVIVLIMALLILDQAWRIPIGVSAGTLFPLFLGNNIFQGVGTLMDGLRFGVGSAIILGLIAIAFGVFLLKVLWEKFGYNLVSLMVILFFILLVT